MTIPHRRAARNHLTLQFYDPCTEAAYEVHERAVYLNRVRIGLSVGIAATVTYLLLSMWATDQQAVITQFRVFVCLPLLCLALGLSFFLKRSLFPMLASILAVVMVGFPGTLLLVGPDVTEFSVTGFVQSLLYLAVLAMVPFRYVLLVAVPSTVLMIGTLLVVDGTGATLSSQLSLIVSFALLLGVVVYMREKAQRDLFLDRQAAESLHRGDLLQKADQIDWLRNLPAQLERDMRRCLFAVETELDGMLDGGALDKPALTRARRGIHDTMKLFETARFASDIDVAEQQRLEPLNLSQLMHEVVLDRSREMEDVHAIELDVQSDVWVQGSAELIRQSVTQILNSATVDVHPEMLLQVALTADARAVVLEVQVQKELVSLDPNLLTNQRFQLGLGLYLARRIFEMHGGEFEVIVQNGMTRYTAKLPLPVPTRVAEESLVDHAS